MEDITAFLEDLPADERKIVSRVRQLIRDADPRIGERLSFGVPYFFHHRRICFLWPISKLPCGYPPPTPDRERVSFGFCYGNMLSNEQGLMQMDNRKQVSVIKLYSPSDINDQIFTEIIQEAIMVDDEFGKRKKKK